MMNDAAIAGLYEAASMIMSQTKRNSRVDTGQTKNAWTYVVDEKELVATVGNPEENAIWEEFGTGEYSLNKNGRKRGWWYTDEKGERHFTYGKTPNRTLFNTFVMKQTAVIKVLQEHYKNKFK